MNRQSIRIVRRCARCNYRGYHWAVLTIECKRKNVQVQCTDCGAHWRGRYIADEWDLVEGSA